MLKSQQKLSVLYFTVKIQATTGYSTDKFLLCFQKFTSNQGPPPTVLSDHGVMLLSSARKLVDPEAKDLDWQRIVGLPSLHYLRKSCC